MDKLTNSIETLKQVSMNSALNSNENTQNPLFFVILRWCIIPLLVAVFGHIIYDFIKNNRKKNINVKVVKNSSDKDINSFIALYNNLFRNTLRIDPNEIISWLDESKALKKAGISNYFHYLLLCKHSGEVVGFLKAMYCSEKKYLFIAYLGIDSGDVVARKYATKKLINRLCKIVFKELKECKAIICEVETPDKNINLPTQEEKVARIRLFKEMAHHVKHKMYEIGIDYLQPVVDLSLLSSSSYENMVLLYVPIKDQIGVNKILPNEKVKDIINFIYWRIYRPTYRHEPDKDFRYQKYLDDLFNLTCNDIPAHTGLKE